MTVIQTRVEDEITRLSDRLEEATEELARLAQEAANAEVIHKREHAKGILFAEGKNQSEREAEAVLGTVNELQARKTAEALHASQLEICRSLRAQLSALQTLVRITSDQVGTSR